MTVVVFVVCMQIAYQNDCDLNFLNENIEQKRRFIKETIETDNYINID